MVLQHAPVKKAGLKEFLLELIVDIDLVSIFDHSCDSMCSSKLLSLSASSSAHLSAAPSAIFVPNYTIRIFRRKGTILEKIESLDVMVKALVAVCFGAPHSLFKFVKL
jgi:hypothetical protein